MDESSPDDSYARADWIGRCAATIRSLGSWIGEADAAELAGTMSYLPRCRALEPEEAARRLFVEAGPVDRWSI